MKGKNIPSKTIKFNALLLLGVIMIPFGIWNDINMRTREHENINNTVQSEQKWHEQTLKSKINTIIRAIIRG